MTSMRALLTALAVGVAAVAMMSVLGGIAPLWAALLGVPATLFTLLVLVSPAGVEPVWAPLPERGSRATEHAAASLASRLAEAAENPARYRTRLRPRLQRIALAELRRHGVPSLDDPRAPELLGSDLHRLVTDERATLPGPAAVTRLLAHLKENR